MLLRLETLNLTFLDYIKKLDSFTNTCIDYKILVTICVKLVYT